MSVNLHQKPLKLGRLIGLQATHPPIKNWFPWQLTLFNSPQSDFIIFGDFNFKKHFKRPQTRPSLFICLLDYVYMAPLGNIKIERQRWPANPLISGTSGTQYVAMVTKLVSSYCGAHLVELYCKKSSISDTNWLRYLFSS